jgi:signal transduction histidine kinase
MSTARASSTASGARGEALAGARRDARPSAAGRFSQRFFAVFNLRTIAVVFYLALAVVIGHFLPVLAVDPNVRAFTGAVTFLRQNLISGLTVLAAIAAVRALAAAPRWSRARSLAIGIAAVAFAALVSAALRLIAFGVPLATIPERWPWAVGVLALWTLIGGLGYALVHFAQEDEQARRRLAEEQLAQQALAAQMTQARLSALQAQIEPHFLFNTLANVKRLYETAPGRGREMLSGLIDYLRAALPTMRQSGSTLRRELELARSYLTILQMRMGERLRFAIDAPPALLEAEVPPLVLGTLIENALKHGLAPLPQGGSIEIRAAGEAGQLRLEVRDTGRGFSGSGGSGVGLANTRSRLAALYGGAATLALAANDPSGVVATVVLPLRPTGAAKGREAQEVGA